MPGSAEGLLGSGSAGTVCQDSVERVMGCGLGGCYSCVVPVKHGDEHANLVRSCISGPVFDGAELVWE